MQKTHMSAGTMETSISDVNHFVLNAKNHRSGLGPTETCNPGPKAAVLHAKATNDGRPHRD